MGPSVLEAVFRAADAPVALALELALALVLGVVEADEDMEADGVGVELLLLEHPLPTAVSNTTPTTAVITPAVRFIRTPVRTIHPHGRGKASPGGLAVGLHYRAPAPGRPPRHAVCPPHGRSR
jgi:hypothetical protein